MSDRDIDDADLPRAFESKRFRAFLKRDRSSPDYASVYRRAVTAVAQLRGWFHTPKRPRGPEAGGDEEEEVGGSSQQTEPDDL